jgi:Fic family protein
MVRPTIIMQYTQPHQMEPLLPQNQLEALRSRSAHVIERSYRLAGAAHVSTIASVRELVREMNSYYSNRIEGQSTHPANIKRALQHDFSDKPETAKLQRLALAHIEAERELEREGTAELPQVLSSEFLRRAHAALYNRLSDADRTTEDGRIVQPGQIRIEQVAVGRHEPPPGEYVPRFLARLDEVYGRPCPMEDRLFTIAAAHQRVAWIHPFSDGNGRASRLQTHCALFPASAGLWSVSRGLARKRDRYYALLAAADGPRQGDLDGRGNLSEKALWAWCAWFIEICEDQVEFMAKMLDMDGMKTRIHALISFLSSQDKRVRMEAALPLYHLFLAGPTPRGEFQQMTGLKDRTARSLLSRLVELGLVTADSHVAPVRIAFPLSTLQFLFPDLYPEASTANIEG